jgi:hypothetical protein
MILVNNTRIFPLLEEVNMSRRTESVVGRFQAFAAWLLTSLAIVLFGTAILVVPSDVFADAGSDCQSYCTSKCGSDQSCWATCPGTCCANATSTWQLDGDCCAVVCKNDNTCIAGCISATQCPTNPPPQLGCVAEVACWFGDYQSSCKANINNICDCANPK